MEKSDTAAQAAGGTFGEWSETALSAPAPLRDVLVAFADVDEQRWCVDLGFRHRNGRWFLTGTVIEVAPSHWMALPEPPAGAAGRARIHHQGRALS